MIQGQEEVTIDDNDNDTCLLALTMIMIHDNCCFVVVIVNTLYHVAHEICGEPSTEYSCNGMTSFMEFMKSSQDRFMP